MHTEEVAAMRTGTPEQAAPTARRRPGRRVAVAVWLLVVLALAVGAVVRFVDYSSRPADQEVPVSGGTVVVPGPGEYSVYAQSDAGLHPLLDADGRLHDDRGTPDPEAGTVAGPFAELDAVVGPSGTPVPLEGSGWSETYGTNDHVGVLVGRFTADRAGTYTVRGHGDGLPPGDRLVVSTRTVGALVGGVFLAVAAFLVLVAGLIVLLVLTLRRRRRASRSGRYGYPPGGPRPR